MRIVNLEAFRALPPWTVFRKYQPCYCGDIEFKLETLPVDFISMQVDMPESHSSEQLFDRLDEMERTGCSYPLYADSFGRDGMFDDLQLFMIYEKDDLIALRGLLDKAVEAYI